MTAADAATQLLTVLERRKRENHDPGMRTTILILRSKNILRAGYDENTMCVAVARVGWQGQQRIVATPLGELAKV